MQQEDVGEQLMSQQWERMAEAADVTSHQEAESQTETRSQAVTSKGQPPRNLLPAARPYFQRGPQKVLPAENQVFKT